MIKVYMASSAILDKAEMFRWQIKESGVKLKRSHNFKPWKINLILSAEYCFKVSTKFGVNGNEWNIAKWHFFLFKKALTSLSLPPTTHYWTDFEWKCIETVTVVDNILQRVSYTCKQKSGTKENEIFVSFCSICQWIILVLFVSQISFLTTKLLSVLFKVKNKADAAKL